MVCSAPVQRGVAAVSRCRCRTFYSHWRSSASCRRASVKIVRRGSSARALDEGEGLQHRVVQVGGDLGALLLADAGRRARRPASATSRTIQGAKITVSTTATATAASRTSRAALSAPVDLQERQARGDDQRDAHPAARQDLEGPAGAWPASGAASPAGSRRPRPRPIRPDRPATGARAEPPPAATSTKRPHDRVGEPQARLAQRPAGRSAAAEPAPSGDLDLGAPRAQAADRCPSPVPSGSTAQDRRYIAAARRRPRPPPGDEHDPHEQGVDADVAARSRPRPPAQQPAPLALHGAGAMPGAWRALAETATVLADDDAKRARGFSRGA